MTMQLIDEIEANDMHGRDSSWGPDEQLATDLVEHRWWPRIRAALLAGEEMANSFAPWLRDDDPDMQFIRRFRAATEGTK